MVIEYNESIIPCERCGVRDNCFCIYGYSYDTYSYNYGNSIYWDGYSDYYDR